MRRSITFLALALLLAACGEATEPVATTVSPTSSSISTPDGAMVRPDEQKEEGEAAPSTSTTSRSG